MILWQGSPTIVLATITGALQRWQQRSAHSAVDRLAWPALSTCLPPPSLWSIIELLAAAAAAHSAENSMSPVAWAF